jgi:glycosyltransferase involved in cell wall biosynthesis
LLAEALASIEAQRYPDWEVIVVDDASAPAVDFRALAHSQSRVVGLRHDTSVGGAAGKNSGIKAGRGEIFAFLDDDDVYDPGYLERSISVLDRHSDIDVLFIGVAWFGKAAAHGERTHGQSMARTLEAAEGIAVEDGVVAFGEKLLPALLRRVPMPFQRPVVRRPALERIGMYRPDCLLWDCEWAIRASIVARCALLTEPLYGQRVDGQGLSSRPDRERDHLASSVDSTLRLYYNPPIKVSPMVRSMLREAASRSAADLAYYHSQRGELRDCLRAWWQSQRVEISLPRLKIPVGALARAVGFIPRVL